MQMSLKHQKCTCEGRTSFTGISMIRHTVLPCWATVHKSVADVYNIYKIHNSTEPNFTAVFYFH